MQTEREKLRAWLATMLTRRCWSGSDLARRISVQPSTINRFLNDPDAKHSLSKRTLRGIEAAIGLAPLFYPPDAQSRAVVEVEALFLSDKDTSSDAAIDEAIRHLRELHSDLSFWQLRSRAIEALCFLPGDVLAVDTSQAPRRGDIVCVEVVQINPGRIETVFRVFEPPYLVASSGSFPSLKPLIVDEQHVVIRGIAVNMFRAMRQKNAS
jgi:transcriptional regulator with XRE-family HTH domain